MDLSDFDGAAIYFDKPPSPEVEALLNESVSALGRSAAELHLLRAFLRAPQNLKVLLALYRYYHAGDRLVEAASVADRLVEASGKELGFPADWRGLERRHLTHGVRHSIGLVRFYLLALKARAAIGLRLKEVESARQMLLKVRELDGADRLGAAALIAIIDHRPSPAMTGGRV